MTRFYKIIGLLLVMSFQSLLAHQHTQGTNSIFKRLGEYPYEAIKVIDAGVLHECLIEGHVGGGIANLNTCNILILMKLAWTFGYYGIETVLSMLNHGIEEILDHICGFHAIGYFVGKQDINTKQLSLCAVIYPLIKPILLENRED